MEPSDAGTNVRVLTDLSITGKVAQFGRGVLADVSTKLLNQFVTNLEASVLGPEVVTAQSDEAVEGQSEREGPDGPPSIRTIDSAPAEPVDLVGVAGSSVARRLRPLLLVAGVVVVIGLVARARRHRQSSD